MRTVQIQPRWRAWEIPSGVWQVAMAGFLLLVGLASGLVAARYGLLVPLATLAGLAAALFAFLRPWDGFLLAAAIAVLLPFGVLPVSLGLTPSFLELTLLGFLGGWLLPLLRDVFQTRCMTPRPPFPYPHPPLLTPGKGVVGNRVRENPGFRQTLDTSPLFGGCWQGRFSTLDALAWTFFGLTLFSLILGYGVTATTLHNYGKFALGLLAFFGVRRLAPTREHLRQFLRLFLLVAGLAATLGILLQALPDALAQNLLLGLGPLGYPTQGRILRYVEDDPNGLERAIGTSVDPNSFGGMLAMAAAMALTPTPPRGIGVRATLLLACLYLTYSRAALGGFLVAVVFLATVRYRRFWWFLLAAALLLILLTLGLGWGGPALERFRQGIFFQDLANRMRLAEFANALAILGRYPTFGVGLGSAPDVDLSTGVSSLYLTIAERMGLLGLVSFLALIGGALAQGLRLARQEEERLALLASVVAALGTGLLDHYFFNLEFPHMVLLLWGMLGLATSVDRLHLGRFSGTMHTALDGRAVF